MSAVMVLRKAMFPPSVYSQNHIRKEDLISTKEMPTKEIPSLCISASLPPIRIKH